MATTVTDYAGGSSQNISDAQLASMAANVGKEIELGGGMYGVMQSDGNFAVRGGDNGAGYYATGSTTMPTVNTGGVSQQTVNVDVGNTTPVYTDYVSYDVPVSTPSQSVSGAETAYQSTVQNATSDIPWGQKISGGVTGKQLYVVQQDGHAPPNMNVGDRVMTTMGTWEITGKNPDGTYQSQYVNGAHIDVGGTGISVTDASGDSRPVSQTDLIRMMENPRKEVSLTDGKYGVYNKDGTISIRDGQYYGTNGGNSQVSVPVSNINGLSAATDSSELVSTLSDISKRANAVEAVNVLNDSEKALVQKYLSEAEAAARSGKTVNVMDNSTKSAVQKYLNEMERLSKSGQSVNVLDNSQMAAIQNYLSQIEQAASSGKTVNVMDEYTREAFDKILNEVNAMADNAQNVDIVGQSSTAAVDNMINQAKAAIQNGNPQAIEQLKQMIAQSGIDTSGVQQRLDELLDSGNLDAVSELLKLSPTKDLNIDYGESDAYRAAQEAFMEALGQTTELNYQEANRENAEYTPTDYTEQINQIRDKAFELAKTQIENQLALGELDIDQAIAKVPQIYESGMNDMAQQYEMNKRNANEYFNANGLSSGARAQALLAMNNVYQSNMAQYRMEEANAIQDYENQRAKLKLEAQGKITEALLQNEQSRAEDLLAEYQRQDDYNFKFLLQKMEDDYKYYALEIEKETQRAAMQENIRETNLSAYQSLMEMEEKRRQENNALRLQQAELAQKEWQFTVGTQLDLAEIEERMREYGINTELSLAELAQQDAQFKVNANMDVAQLEEKMREYGIDTNIKLADLLETMREYNINAQMSEAELNEKIRTNTANIKLNVAEAEQGAKEFEIKTLLEQEELNEKIRQGDMDALYQLAQALEGIREFDTTTNLNEAKLNEEIRQADLEAAYKLAMATEGIREFDMGMLLDQEKLNETIRQADAETLLKLANVVEAMREFGINTELSEAQLNEKAREFGIDIDLSIAKLMEEARQADNTLQLNYDKLTEDARQADIAAMLKGASSSGNPSSGGSTLGKDNTELNKNWANRLSTFYTNMDNTDYRELADLYTLYLSYYDAYEDGTLNGVIPDAIDEAVLGAYRDSHSSDVYSISEVKQLLKLYESGTAKNTLDSVGNRYTSNPADYGWKTETYSSMPELPKKGDPNTIYVVGNRKWKWNGSTYVSYDVTDNGDLNQYYRG